MRQLKMPSAYTILLILVIFVAGLTWIMPAGQYQLLPDGEPIAGTYRTVARNGQGLIDIARAPLEGFLEAIEIAVFILTVGGFLGVMTKTGAIDAGIGAIVETLKEKSLILIPILMAFFSLGGTTFGMAEETIAFYPLLIPVLVASGYDSLTAISVILLGAGAGVIGSTVNPFATGIASGFAGISMGEGIGLRLLIYGLSLGLSMAYVLFYANRILKDPSHSLIFSQYEEHRRHFALQNTSGEGLSRRQKLALILFGLTFLVMVYGVIPFDEMGITLLPTLGWWFPELAVLFLVSAILTGMLCRVGEREIVDGFVSGAADLLGVGFIIGISRGITVIMNNGLITDTILSWGESLLSGSGGIAFAASAFFIFLVLSFLIPSSSGLATLAMPIMAPLAEMTGVSRALVVTAFQTASGIVNLVTPTSAVVMGALAIGRVSYGVWLKFVWKLLAGLLAIGLGCLIAVTFL